MGSPLELTSRVIVKAFEDLNIPQVIDPIDIATDEPDSLSVMTYLSFFRQYALAAKEIEIDLNSLNSQTPAVGETLSFHLKGKINQPSLISTTSIDGNSSSGATQGTFNPQATKVEFPLNLEGKRLFAVFHRGFHIANSPFGLYVKETRGASIFGNSETPSVDNIGGDDLMVAKNTVHPHLAIVGKTFEFEILCTVNFPSDLQVTVTNAEGTFQGDFQLNSDSNSGKILVPLKIEGVHNISVKSQDLHIKGSPVEIEAKVHPAMLISIVESSVHHEKAVSGKQFRFRIAGPIEVPSSIEDQMVCNL
eukprot:TRINITY_DN4222_c0_g1_i4.p1 TRINITY_DN4222_c0_g1~~TRINITY_DN4222_c0_g1_i4.p1  ORF type:complete len:306 (+),score=77.05 TRINITY_DN4222_c0_g1_i4:722-1639(+)